MRELVHISVTHIANAVPLVTKHYCNSVIIVTEANTEFLGPILSQTTTQNEHMPHIYRILYCQQEDTGRIRPNSNMSICAT